MGAAEDTVARSGIKVACFHADEFARAADRIRELKFLAPKMAIVVSSASEHPALILRCLIAGAVAYVFGAAPPEQFRQALSDAAQGRVYLSRRAWWAVLQYLRGLAVAHGTDHLTDSQAEMCIWLCSRPEMEVAQALAVPQGTVHAHARAIYKKLAVHGRKGFLHLLNSAR